jgi:hypothetical protein
MLIEEVTRVSTKAITRSSAAAFVAKLATREVVHHTVRKARKDAMKQRNGQKSGNAQQGQLGHH